MFTKVIKKRPQEIEVKLRIYHHQNGGDKLPPFLDKRKLDEDLDVAIYHVSETEEQADGNSTITIAPHNGGKQSLLTVNLVDPERYAIIIDDPLRGKIDGKRIISDVAPAEVCASFCRGFVEYLQEEGLILHEPKGKKQPFAENMRAIDDYISNPDDVLEIFEEWKKLREIASRSKTATNLWELFRKSVIYPAREIRKKQLEKA